MITNLLLKFYSVDSALSAFNKAILRLRKAADLQRQAAAKHEASAATALTKKATAEAEATRALNAATKMEAIVS